MQALQMVAHESEAELRDVPQPEPGRGAVLLKVAGAGACHSDLHVMEWPAEALSYDLPFTLGHENSGRVAAGRGAAGGAGAARWGRRTAASWHPRSGRPAAGWAATAAWRSTCWCRPRASSCRSATSTRCSPHR